MSDFTGKLGTLIVACALLALPRVGSSQDRPAEKASRGKPAEKPSPAAKKNVDPEAARKAFQDLVRRVLGAGKPVPPPKKKPGVRNAGLPPAVRRPGAVVKKKKPVGNGDPEARDRIDLLAPQDPRQAKLIRQAVASAAAQQYDRVLEAVSVLLNPPADAKFEADSLFRRSDGTWVRVRDEANRLLGGLPEASRETFRSRFGAEARARLDRATTSGNEASLVDVADRFFHTPAGRSAANRLGSRHIDRGRFGLGAYWFGRLLEAEDPVVQQPAWRLKAALVFHSAGQGQRSSKLLEGLVSEGQLSLPDGRKATVAEWLEVSRSRQLPDPVLSDWPVFYGSAGRTGRSDGGAPLLLPRWHRPLTHRHRVAEMTRELIEDLEDLGRTMIPAFVPLVIGEKAVYRTLRGIEVVDIDSGRVLWETRPERSVESILSGTNSRGLPQFGPVIRMPIPIGGAIGIKRLGPADQHPLTRLLFRNALHGIPASDGQRVFLVEDKDPLGMGKRSGFVGGFIPMGGRKPAGDWNRLASYSLQTGRPDWEIGGMRMNEPFDLPLAGTRFLGAPVPVDGQLFVVGERNNEIRLHVIEAATGRPAWSQRVAYSDGQVLPGFDRRYASSHVAVSDGIAVCPTTVGWLVGIECSSRRTLWAYRYASPLPEEPSRRGMVIRVPGGGPTTIDSHWAATPPVISGERLIFSSPAEPVLVCLDLFSGRKIWQRPRGSSLYVAGCFGDKLLLVGADAVTALALDDGKVAWTRTLEKSQGRPCGRGVATKEVFFLPLSAGQVVALRLADGKQVLQTFLSGSDDQANGVLGNMVLSGGLLLSLGPAGLTGFEQQAALTQRIAAAEKQEGRSGWASIKKAELALLSRDHATALARLRKVVDSKLDPALKARWRNAYWTALEGAVRADLKGAPQEIEDLASLVRSPEERLKVTRLRSERAVARGDYVQAVAMFRSLADQAPGRLVRRGEATRVEVRMDRWVSGQLADLWTRLPAELKSQLDGELKKSATSVIGGPLAAARKFVVVFGFHPAATSVRFHLAEQAARAGRLAEAETDWLTLAGDRDPVVVERAEASLAASMKQQGLSDMPATVTWPAEVSIIRAAGSSRSERRFDLLRGRGGLPWFRGHRCLFDSNRRRLVVERIVDGTRTWSVPLKQAAAGPTAYFLPVETVGHQLILAHRGVIQALCPVTRRVLWSFPVEGNPRAVSVSSRRQVPPLLKGARGFQQLKLANRRASRGPLCVANARYVCVQGRRKLTVLETRTGRVIWQRDHLPQGTFVCGTEEVVYLQWPAGNDATSRPPEALRAADGRPLEVKGLGQRLAGAVRLAGFEISWVHDTKFFSLPGLPGLEWSQPMLQCDDVRTGATRWKQRLDAKAYLGLLDRDHLVQLGPSGQLELIDLDGGTRASLGGVKPEDLKGRTSLYAVADLDHVYLVLNKPRQGSYYSINLSSVRVNGMICSFARRPTPPREARLEWKHEFSGQNLILEKFQHTPLLLLVAKDYKRQDNLRYYLLKLAVVDKKTGKVRVKFERPSNYWSFRGLRLNLAERYLELSSYNQRIRLVAGAAAPEKDDRGSKKKKSSGGE